MIGSRQSHAPGIGVSKKIQLMAAALLAVALSACSGPSTSGGGEVDVSPDASAAPPQTPPSIKGDPDLNATVGEAYKFSPMAADSESRALVFTIENAPDWIAFDEHTGEISGTPDDGDVATYSDIVISVSNGDSTAKLATFTITVGRRPRPVRPPLPDPKPPSPDNHAPTIAGSPATSVTKGDGYSFAPSVNDVDGDQLRFSIANKPSWASFSTTTGKLAGSTSAAQVKTYGNIVISVSDGEATATLPAFAIEVQAGANAAPRISGTPGTRVTESAAYSFTPSASDADGDALTFSIQNKPSWASFSTANGKLSGTPTAAQIGSYGNIVISVSDGEAKSSLAAFSINVVDAPNSPPSISGSPLTSVEAGSSYSFTPVARDNDGDELEFSIKNKPSWANFSASTGKLSGTPAQTQVGTFSNISISVSDGAATASLAAFDISVTGTPNRAPAISGTPASSVTPGSSYSFTPSASDADGDKLTFSIQGKPVWATFNSATGALTGTPSTAQAGKYSGILITVSDGDDTASLPAFSVTVAAPSNSAPNITGTPGTSVVAGSSYSFTPSASDADSDSLKFSIQNKPSWASFDTNTGRLSGTTDSGDVGSTKNIVISVSDGQATDSLLAFALAVTAAAQPPPSNSPPVISGNPSGSVQAGSSYSFTPSASDPNRDKLTFSIQNRPSWASFDASTGRLSGTPSSGNVSTFSNIIISVSDGKASDALASFTIAVTSPPQANRAPAISGSPTKSLNSGSAYSFTPSASDADDDPLTFSIQNKPSWASFDDGTGRLSGTPDSGDVGTYSGIVISVSDGKVNASLATFSITVAQVSMGSAELNWSAPTQNTDGSTLTDLSSYKIYYGTSKSSMTQTVKVSNAGVTTYTVQNLSPATWYFGITAVDSTGLESAMSNVGSKTIQ